MSQQTTANGTPVAVLGAGSWGTALALLLAQGGSAVRLWDRTAGLVESIRAEGENRRYLPGTRLPASIAPTTDMEAAVAGAACVVVAVPSTAVGGVLAHFRPYLSDTCDIVLASKGLAPDSGMLPFEVAEAELGHANAIVALSGPNLAGEIARGVPAAAIAACPDPDAARRTALLFSRPTFRVYTGTDRTGVEIGGAVKNVLAIAGGVSDGLGFGDNAKAALLTRGLAEMTRFGVACGARQETFYGLAGVGDLMATAASRLSRNWRVGEGIAQGETLEAILARLGQVAEGVPTARAVVHLSKARGVDMPVCRAVAGLLFDGWAPMEAVTTLLSRAQRDE